MTENALTMFSNIRVQDILDIAIISVMISALLIWFKDRASRFVFLGITLLGAIYLLARFFQLYLTTLVLQAFFAILLFVLVVIFQEDLRRFFERLALLGRFRKRLFAVTAFNESAEIIAQTAADLARKKIGALIVLQGEDPLDRHLTGGSSLDGLLSQPLLESIFDPHSIGHDGAALIDGNRLMRFGCHLPLSANAAQHGNLGLRHTAALGLSERSDALCIVVSEERGSISLARGERIEEIANASALRIELEAFFAKRMPLAKPRLIRNWLQAKPAGKGDRRCPGLHPLGHLRLSARDDPPGFRRPHPIPERPGGMGPGGTQGHGGQGHADGTRPGLSAPAPGQPQDFPRPETAPARQPGDHPDPRHGKSPFQPHGCGHHPGADQDHHVAPPAADRSDRSIDGKQAAAGHYRPERSRSCPSR